MPNAAGASLSLSSAACLRHRADLRRARRPPLRTQVALYLPSLHTLRTVVERLRTISSYITISANNAGELRCVAAAVPRCALLPSRTRRTAAVS